MSEYQYYEFCSLYSPLTQEASKKLHSLSSRARVGTHNASYVYNYGDFRGNPEKLLLKYFDVFFYISNFGIVQLMFRYPSKQINIEKMKKYAIKDVIGCKKAGQYVVLSITVSNEEGFGWTEGEGLLPQLLPLYEEITEKNYQLLHLVSAIDDQLTGIKPDALKSMLAKTKLSPAQKVFLDILQLEA